MELEVYKKSDFYEDHISSQKEYYERENADAYFAERLAEKDDMIMTLQNANKENAEWCIRLQKLVDEKNKEIARLKAEIERTCTETTKEDPLDRMLRQKIKENDELKEQVHDLEVDLEGAKATAYADSVDAGMRERRLKRALYKACANWCKAESGWHLTLEEYQDWKKWEVPERKCRAMAERYGEGK